MGGKKKSKSAEKRYQSSPNPIPNCEEKPCPADEENNKRDSENRKPSHKIKIISLMKRTIIRFREILAALVLILAFIAYRDPIRQIFMPVNEYLVIQSASITPELPYIFLKPDIDPSDYSSEDIYNKRSDISLKCLNDKNQKCDFFLIRDDYQLPRVYLDVSSQSIYSPIKVSDIDLTFSNYEELPDSPYEYLIWYPCGGGGGTYNVFQIGNYSDTDANIRDQYSLVSKLENMNPNDFLGLTLTAERVCEKSDCQDFISVSNQDLEGLELRMPFLKDLPNGWYEFDIRISFLHNDQLYKSQSKYTLNIIKPQKISPWWSQCNEETIRSFVDIDTVSNVVYPNVNIKPSNTAGKLILNTYAADEDGFYELEFNTSKLRHIGEQNLIPSEIYKPINAYPEITSDGLVWVYEYNRYEDFRLKSVEIGLMDLAQEKFIIITPENNSINLQPSISPSGRYVAFVQQINRLDSLNDERYEADLFVYDRKLSTAKRITNSPHLIERSPVWINENSIAFLIPPVIDNSSGQEEKIQYNQGLKILDLLTEEVEDYHIDIDEYSRLDYFDETNSLVIVAENYFFSPQYLLSLSDGRIDPIKLPPYNPEDSDGGCRLINTEPFVFLCKDGQQKNVAIFQYKEGMFRKVYDEDGFENFSLAIGRVIPDNIAIADLSENLIHEFNSKGINVRDWEIPKLSVLLNNYGEFGSPDFIIIPGVDIISHSSQITNDQQDKYWEVTNRILDKSTDSVSISANIPFLEPGNSFTSVEFNNIIHSFVDNQISNVLDSIDQEYISEHKEIYEDVTEFIHFDYSVVSHREWQTSLEYFDFPVTYSNIAKDDAIFGINNKILSVIFRNIDYFGGAHPSSNYKSINFNMTTGRVIELKDLFNADSSYLQVISDYCINFLSARKESLFDDYEENLYPLLKNFKIWGITQNGIVIVFSEYHIGPGAAGPQYVIIPFKELEEIIDPNGPLGDFFLIE